MNYELNHFTKIRYNKAVNGLWVQPSYLTWDPNMGHLFYRFCPDSLIALLIQ